MKVGLIWLFIVSCYIRAVRSFSDEPQGSLTFLDYRSNENNSEDKNIDLSNNLNSAYDSSLQKCTVKICHEEGGKCVNETTCECNEDYTTLSTDKSYKLCNYKKKSRYSTAIIELFVGFGVGHLYSDRRVNGYFKLMLFMLLCCVAACSIAVGVRFEQDHPNSENAVVKFFFCIYACTFNIILTWQIFDFLMFVLGFYKDGNNIAFA